MLTRKGIRWCINLLTFRGWIGEKHLCTRGRLHCKCETIIAILEIQILKYTYLCIGCHTLLPPKFGLIPFMPCHPIIYLILIFETNFAAKIVTTLFSIQLIQVITNWNVNIALQMPPPKSWNKTEEIVTCYTILLEWKKSKKQVGSF